MDQPIPPLFAALAFLRRGHLVLFSRAHRSRLAGWLPPLGLIALVSETHTKATEMQNDTRAPSRYLIKTKKTTRQLLPHSMRDNES